MMLGVHKRTVIFYIALLFFQQTQPLTKAANSKTINGRNPDTYCDIGGCACTATAVTCQLKDCNASGPQFIGVRRIEYAAPSNHCTLKTRTKYNHLFVPRIIVPVIKSYLKESEFSMENCLQTPEALRQKKLSYYGTVVHDKLSAANGGEDIYFQNSHNLWELNHISENASSGELIAQLLLDLDQLKELDLTADCTGGANIIPGDLLHTLDTLETLRLDISGARPQLTAAHFRDLKKLKILRLDDNRLRTLAADIFKPVYSLEHLNLSLNALARLPADLLSAQYKLKSLDLSYNKLKSLPHNFFKRQENLEVLLLAHNEFSMPNNVIEHSVNFFNLREFDLSYNQLSGLRGTGLYENKTILTRPIHTRFSYYSALNLHVNLSHNNISMLSFDWFKYIKDCYYTYDLSHNNIKHVTFLKHPGVNMVRCWRKWLLANNPLHCDCQLAWLINNGYQFDTSDWRCTFPEYLSTRALNALNSSALCNWSPASCPEKCACSYDTSALLVNCTKAQLSQLPSIPRPEQVSRSSTTLNINNNTLYELPLNTSFGYAQVTRLYAAYNKLTSIHSKRLPPNLTVLDVRANKLERLSNYFLLRYVEASETLEELYISGNPWICDCGAELLLRVVRAQRKRILDADAALCANLPNVTLTDVIFTDICHVNKSRAKIFQLALVLTIVITMLISAFALYYKYKLQIKIWLYAHHICQCCITVETLDSDKTFDAFISYSHQQQHYVNHILLPQLEQGDPPYRICTHERNWLAGAYIPEQIIESVEQSRRTIIVMSDDFIASDWARMEFRMAHQSALNERRARIIIIKYGELTNVTQLDKELQAYLKMNTYLDFNDSRFWQKLRYALPHKIGIGSKSDQHEGQKPINFIGQDKLILR
ncbi:protein toll-like [Bactrocera neohumeralis]|uniref:protein toll-like n=1 Tax=Bactrocera neohumeralis TaxID=98809 RepID=UPI002165F6C0|nr:protein toll-like [Bactrocera neohumeralis]XP_050332210.1 protein toll-like [Bactrocera neohumeralis]